MEKKNTKETTNVGRYAALAGAFLATGAINAQSAYVDVNPDAVVNAGNSPFNLDFDGDTNDDFTVSVGTFSGSFSTYI